MKNLLVFALLAAVQWPEPSFALGGGTKEKLKAGGYVIVMRYAETPKGLGDPPGFDLNNCTTQRNLNQEGRNNLKSIHEHFKKAGIKITKALASHWCRTVETAKILAPEVQVEALDELDAHLSKKDQAQRQEAISKMRREISDWRGPGNLLLVSHKQTILAITGRSLSRGEYIVIDPKRQRVIANDY